MGNKQSNKLTEFFKLIEESTFHYKDENGREKIIEKIFKVDANSQEEFINFVHKIPFYIELNVIPREGEFLPNSCSICGKNFCQIEYNYKIKCEHSFHFHSDCLKNYVNCKQNIPCPICGKKIN